MTGRPLSFGLKTLPQNTDFDALAAVWSEADAIPEIEHAWLWDHFLPLRGDAGQPIHEGWTMLAALAARTERLGLGLLVTSNRIRPPAVLGKIAATVDHISHGRLTLGIGVGGTHQPDPNPAVREYAAYGIDLVPPAEGIARLDEACTIIRRMWTEESFDFDGRYYRLTGARCEPKPVQRPGPPLLIGAFGERSTLRVVAKHADIWNVAGPPFLDLAAIARKSARLDEFCAEIGRDPAEITRSVQVITDPTDAGVTREALRGLIRLGFTHLVVNAPPGVESRPARWVADNLILPVLTAS